jgi:hypothetical protein
MGNSNHEFGYLMILAWINYLIGLFINQPLQSLALVLSIIGSLTYIILNILKIYNFKKDEKDND